MLQGQAWLLSSNLQPLRAHKLPFNNVGKQKRSRQDIKAGHQSCSRPRYDVLPSRDCCCCVLSKRGGAEKQELLAWIHGPSQHLLRLMMGAGRRSADANKYRGRRAVGCLRAHKSTSPEHRS